MTNKTIAAAIAATLSMNLAFGQSAVSLIGENAKESQINESFRRALDIRYFFTVPKISYSDLPDSLEKTRSSNTDKAPLVLFDYTKIDQTDEDATGSSDLGLRLIVADGKEPRTSISQKLASSGLVKTGDIILTGRPALAGTIPYIHVQLGVTHAGMALVKKDAKDGKEYVYNVDMPLNAEMLGPNRDSKLTSEHYMEDKMMFHIIRPKNMNETQRSNVAKWMELLLKRSASIYQPSPDPKNMVVKKSANKISFNYDYMNPTYDLAKKGSADELNFVADLGRLALSKNVPEGLAMYCSEFAWAVLSLKDCNPDTTASQFDGDGTPSCVSKAFEPMPVFGSLYESQHNADDVQFGMSDGPIVLADVIKADETHPNAKGETERSRLLRATIFNKQETKQGGLSAGHLAVQAALLQKQPDFYAQVINYYNLTSVPNSPNFAQQLGIRNYMRQAFNAGNKPNYSPTAFYMHALMPDVFEGQKMTQKQMDYVGTLYFIPGNQQVKVGNSAIRAFDALVQSAKNTK